MLRSITEKLLHEKEFVQWAAALKKEQPATMDGIWGSSYALVAAALAEKNDIPILLLFAKQEEIDPAEDALSLFTDIPVFPFAPINDMETPFRLGDETFGQRIRLLKRLSGTVAESTPLPKEKRLTDFVRRKSQTAIRAERTIIVTSIAAMLQPVPTEKVLRAKSQILTVGETLDQNFLARWLVEGGYHSTSGVELPGEFAVRGSLVDIFAPDADLPVRVEFFGDEIESIRTFEVASQRSKENLRQVELSRLQQDATYTGCLSDYLPDETAVIMVEPHEIEQQGHLYLERLLYPEKLHKINDLFKRLLKFTNITASTLVQHAGEINYQTAVESVERLQGDLPKIRESLESLQDREIHLVCQTEAETQRLQEAFHDSAPMKQGRLFTPIGRLHAGFRLVRHDTVIIGTGQLFQRTDLRRTRRRQLGQVIDSFTELKPGDYVVHISHGIARYRGLELMTKGLQEEEHLKLEFADQVVLYVPISKIALVQKYVGGSRSRPKLGKIGGQLWNKQKKDVQKAVFDLALDMIDLQAARENQPGIAFPYDSDWQTEFDSAFPYRETEDQLFAIDAIKNDMLRPRPMDRLICGDVGFGKTEIAMRAAFKAADAGYQVAVLVPTTILAEQHFRTFSERMAEFPFEIASLSRFSTKKKQKATIQRLADGAIDIVIGTHRLAQADVAFHNLGLLIIDEEQRFGVADKERLKKYRATVDVLTMTATPIPRTLHLSLLGIRDISNLETPPEDRMAVETKLVRWDDKLIRTVLLRELNRGGQAFFVHNKVYDIEATAEKLRRIVPEARVEVGHAQMNEHELEQVMLDFVNHKFDVLVATTIIESGLDIPNANTIFIDNADRYGLADLHQLRGRVGRYKNQAYCYLLLDQNQYLNPVSAKRLRAIEEFSHLGAGFSIAMRDLEIRGAGNILGTQQSGHIAMVGYEMYCQFLEASVRMLKNLPQKTVIEVEIDLPGKALIPKSYVTDQRMKIDLYRRMVRVSTQEELNDFRSEIVDRFGKPPQSVERLLSHAQIRVDAQFWKIKAIRKEGRYLVCDFLDSGVIDKLRKISSRTIRLTDDKSAYIPFPKKEMDDDSILYFAKSVLHGR